MHDPGRRAPQVRIPFLLHGRLPPHRKSPFSSYPQRPHVIPATPPRHTRNAPTHSHNAPTSFSQHTLSFPQHTHVIPATPPRHTRNAPMLFPSPITSFPQHTHVIPATPPRHTRNVPMSYPQRPHVIPATYPRHSRVGGNLDAPSTNHSVNATSDLAGARVFP